MWQWELHHGSFQWMKSFQRMESGQSVESPCFLRTCIALLDIVLISIWSYHVNPNNIPEKKKNVTTFGLLVPFWCDFILFMISKLINWNKQQNRTRCTWMICDDDKFPIHWVGQLAPTLCSNVHPLFTCHQIQHHETIQSKSKKKKPCATKIDLIQSKTCTLDQRNPMSTTINFQIATENVVLLRFPNNWE